MRAGLVAAVALTLPGCGTRERAPSESVTLAFVGDVTFDATVMADLAERGGPGAALEPTRGSIEAADWAAFNLESAVSDGGEPIDKTYTFDSDPSALAALAGAGFDLANLANNHVLDYGAQGLVDTRAHLDGAGIANSGITRLDDPQTPFVTRIVGLDVGFLGYADDQAPTAYAPEFLAFETRPARADATLIERDLSALRPRVDVVVVEVHWGVELEDTTDRQRDLGHFMIDHGADIVAGHHPHVVQGAEWYGRGLILYSLGHFVFPFPADPAQMKSVLVRVRADAAGVHDAERLDLAMRVHEWIPRPVTGVFERID